jgi:tetratricopeptide (TPR) repeat protein
MMSIRIGAAHRGRRIGGQLFALAMSAGFSLGVTLGVSACAHESNVGAAAPSREARSQRRLQYLVATPAAVMPDLAAATKPGAEPVGADERLEHWVKRHMRGAGLSVVTDASEAHDVELRLAVESRPMGKLTRGRAAMQVIAGDHVLSQWKTDEHVESARGFDTELARDLVAKLAQSPGLASYADSLYGHRMRSLNETVGRRSISIEQDSPPPLEQVEASGSSGSRGEPLVAAPPSAENLQAAGTHAQQGAALAQSGQLREAYEQFEEAFLLSGDPGYVYEMGECQRNLGDGADALGFYRDYLRRAPNGARATDAANRVRDLEAKPASK